MFLPLNLAAHAMELELREPSVHLILIAGRILAALAIRATQFLAVAPVITLMNV